jgi:hypothetical protein
VKVGIMLAFTVTLIVVIVAQPEDGVKVYVVDPAPEVLIVAGLHVPVIPLIDVVGIAPGAAPTQYGPNAVNVGVIVAFTVTLIVVVVAQPEDGVKVNVVEPTPEVLIVAGFQVPVIPLIDVVGKAPGAAPTQYGPNAVNVGVVVAFIVTLIVVVIAHPEDGVKVYVVVPAPEVLIVAGLHVPVIPFIDVVGKAPDAAPTQYGPRVVKVGVIPALTTTVIVVVDAHWLQFGVNVYILLPVLEVFIVAGDQVPVIPFIEVVKSEPGVSPVQYGPN